MPDARFAPNDGLSHVIGGQVPPLVDLTIPQFLAATVDRHGDREAAVFLAANERWTWDQYYQTAAFFAQVDLKADPASAGKTIGSRRERSEVKVKGPSGAGGKEGSPVSVRTT